MIKKEAEISAAVVVDVVADEAVDVVGAVVIAVVVVMVEEAEATAATVATDKVRPMVVTINKATRPVVTPKVLLTHSL